MKDSSAIKDTFTQEKRTVTTAQMITFAQSVEGVKTAKPGIVVSNNTYRIWLWLYLPVMSVKMKISNVNLVVSSVRLMMSRRNVLIVTRKRLFLKVLIVWLTLENGYSEKDTRVPLVLDIMEEDMTICLS